MRALLVALRHPVAVWRMARTMRAASDAVLRAETARYAADVAEFEATSRRLHQANTNLEAEVTTLRHHVTLTREHLALLSADAGESTTRPGSLPWDQPDADPTADVEHAIRTATAQASL